MILRIVLALTLTALATGANAAPEPEIRTSDVDLFYKIYDQAAGMPSAEMLQKDYIEAGSDAVRQFVPQRILSGERLAETIQKHPEIYEQARRCAAPLPRVKRRLAAALHKLGQLYPEATFPPVTVLIGRNNSGGTTGKSGVLIGLEVVCRANWMQPDLEERLVHMIAHEYGHVEQGGDDDSRNHTLLAQALHEGGAELVAELISGEVSNIHLQKWTRGREREIDTAFLAQIDSTDLSAWLYNGEGTPDKPGDLGYWVGYRILKAYYRRATDKRAALAAILALKDPKALLAESGFQPGQTD